MLLSGVGQYAPAHYNQPKENVVKSSGHENTQLYIDGCGNSEGKLSYSTCTMSAVQYIIVKV